MEERGGPQPFVEALRLWVHTSSDDELREAAGDSGAELARLAPELESRIGPFPEGPELSAAEQRLRLYDGIARCFFHLAEPGVVGLMVIVLATAFNGITEEHRIGLDVHQGAGLSCPVEPQQQGVLGRRFAGGLCHARTPHGYEEAT